MRSAAKTIAAMTPTPPESTMSQSPQKHAQKVFLCLLMNRYARFSLGVT